MALTLPKTWGVEALTHTDLNANFAAIVNKVNGQLDSTNLAATGAGITNSQLANSNYEIVLNREITGVNLNALITDFHLIGSLPYDSVGGITSTYTILGLEFMSLIVSAPGGLTSPVYTLVYGTAAQIAAATGVTILANISAGTATAGQRLTPTTSTVSIANTGVPNNDVKYFALDITTAGVGYNAGPTLQDSFCISIKLKRTLGLRG